MIDYKRLREDLINYFGTAIYYNRMAIMELEEVKQASDEELVKIAYKNGFDIERYRVNIK